MNINIIKANKSHTNDWLTLRKALWGHHTATELRRDMANILNSRREIAFLAFDKNDHVLGFIELSVRPYADGCTTRPVGYLEGIYVVPKHRKHHIASALLRVGEAWIVSKGCLEIGSDTQIDGTVSISWHQACGFRIAERQVAFIKRIRKKAANRVQFTFRPRAKSQVPRNVKLSMSFRLVPPLEKKLKTYNL